MYSLALFIVVAFCLAIAFSLAFAAYDFVLQS